MQTHRPGPRSRLAAGLAAAGLIGAGAIATATRRDRARVAGDPEDERLRTPVPDEELRVRGADGTELHAELFGPEDAPPVVLSHGWTCNRTFWRRQVAALRASPRVVVYDHRGHGRSAPPAGGDYSIEAFGADLQAVLERCVEDGRPAVLGGHSMGAMAIVSWAHHHPGELGRARAAALINTGMGDFVTETLVVRGPDRLGPARALLGHAALRSELPLRLVPDPIAVRVIARLALGPGASPALAELCREMVVSCHPAARGSCGGTLSRLELSEAVAALDVPAVVIAGERDLLTPAAPARSFAARLPRLLELVELERIGHMAPLEDPEAVTGVLRSLAASDRPAPAGTRA